MSTDKRSVSTDALETLGTIIDQNQKRDAIHLAVEPVQAAKKLSPGHHIGLDAHNRATDDIELCKDRQYLGIVDPFLQEPFILEDEYFWLIVYPRQITSLRHVWTHPDFPESNKVVFSSFKEASLAWLKNFAEETYNDFDLMMWSVADGIGEGSVCIHNGSSCSVPPEFWQHYEIAIGIKVPKKHQTDFFSCYC